MSISNCSYTDFPTYNNKTNDPKCSWCDQSSNKNIHAKCSKVMALHRNLSCYKPQDKSSMDSLISAESNDRS
ncbi:MAG: hypothetical protein K2Y01_08860 [Rhabdochlamydiaceae bacterium]|nr:hypothetical protein [Rhabdochlamydiaceae bacterium]